MTAGRLLVGALAAAAAAQSFRAIPTTREAMQKLLSEILDRLERLEKGSGLKGVVSFGPVVQVGDVQLKVVAVPGPGNHRNLVATNVLTGATATVATL